ncbi:3-hydroxymyristoyl/3-hydroxydecanoyl-(acyl carrier protein) dehydratase [Sphaerotilus hippei]|uniref:3-hydroxymyristoyl/3-hydroxydecanoyl-(Acyl carrier protein) dehydratase n=1 Tax=Sphaerotilus hippei TaxID=744406 RepID=A0A318HC00_9BURK|nr:beta-hydroxyacyl-ACP dehydratase [Sphaerotilus hippei]PXW96631.1 3-hydroxymyristoyl/3-hydroxydecanoyl-(acyl carrier protein) dehydratase [Sphaerotilus hippei]
MSRARLTVAVDHPAFAGHFPGQPLLPGVALLAEVMEAVQAIEGGLDAGCAVPVLKFLHPVRPGDHLRIDWTRQQQRLRFEVWCRAAAGGDEVLAASGQLELRA